MYFRGTITQALQHEAQEGTKAQMPGAWPLPSERHARSTTSRWHAGDCFAAADLLLLLLPLLLLLLLIVLLDIVGSGSGGGGGVAVAVPTRVCIHH